MHRLLHESDVYLDTDLVVNAVFSGLQNSEACLSSCQLLVDEERTAYYSQILHIEFMQALRRLATKSQLPGPTYREFELSNWAESHVRERWMKFGFSELQLFLNGLPQAIELPLEAPIFEIALRAMAKYGLASLDATHLATAHHYNIPVFWTCDDHFRRVDDLAVEIIRDVP